MPYYYSRFRKAIRDWIYEIEDLEYRLTINTTNWKFSPDLSDKLYDNRSLIYFDKIQIWNNEVIDYELRLKHWENAGDYFKTTELLLACLNQCKQKYIDVYCSV